jgi:hypothetical protein
MQNSSWSTRKDTLSIGALVERRREAAPDTFN